MRRLASIDVVKGVAALAVLAIHAEVLPGHPLMRHVVNHAVPIFVVLMGVNAGLWWQRQGAGARAWYAGRFRRLYPPLWAALAAWWVLALAGRPPGLHLSWRLGVAHALGYVSHVPTGWFPTHALGHVALLPLLVVAARRWGGLPVVVAGLVVTLGVVAVRMPLVAAWGAFNVLVFAPRLLAHVAFGLWLAPRVARLDRRTVLVAAAALVPLVGAQEWPSTRAVAPFAERLVDLPLTVVLLATLPPVGRWTGCERVLAWLGRASYGMYLGQMLTLSAVLFSVGRAPFASPAGAWALAGLLGAGALVAIAVGERIRRAAGL